jgi:hypothetical protein
VIAEVPAVSPVKLKVAIPLDPVVAVELAITVVVPETANIALPGTTFPAASLTVAVMTPAVAVEPVWITGITSVDVTDAAAP